MIWFTWRQHRIEALILVVLLVLITIILLITGTNISSAAKHVGSLHCASEQCITAQLTLQNYISGNAFGISAFFTVFQFALLALPVCIGMFVGVPTVARELEQGTYRLIWTQSISWGRWLLFKVGGITIYILCATLIISRLFLWWKIPVLASSSTIQSQYSQWAYLNYDIWGIPAIAYTVFALLLGIAVGTILRKIVPAIGVTLVLFVVVRILIEIFWRPYFLPPMVLTMPAYIQQTPPASALTINVYEIDKAGKQVLPINDSSNGFATTFATDICSKTYPPIPSGIIVPSTNPLAKQEKLYQQCVIAHGFKTVYLYQPGDRLLLFQEIECGIYLLLSAMLLTLTLWWIKHRIIG